MMKQMSLILVPFLIAFSSSSCTYTKREKAISPKEIIRQDDVEVQVIAPTEHSIEMSPDGKTFVIIIQPQDEQKALTSTDSIKVKRHAFIRALMGKKEQKKH